MKIIALAGRKSAGKDTVGKFLTRNQKEFWPNKKIHKYAFGDELKRFCNEYLDVPAEWLWGTEEQKNMLVEHIIWENMPHYKDIPTDVISKEMDCEDGGKAVFSVAQPKTGPMTVRQIMQEVGTGWFRKAYPPVWINKLIKNIQDGNADIAIITDLRFIDEAEAIQKHNGVVIYLNRKVPPISNHPSEGQLENWNKLDLFVNNDEMSIDTTNYAVYSYLYAKRIIDRTKGA